MPERLGNELKADLWSYDDFPVTDQEPISEAASGVVSLSYIGAALKRKRWIWLTTTVVGVLLAGYVLSGYHTTYAATSTVVVVPDPTLDANTAIQTDQLLTQDPAFATIVMQKLGVSGTAADFLKTYTTAIVNNNVLSITATNPSATAVVNEAAVLAKEFLQYRAQNELNKQQANDLAQNAEIAREQQTLTALNKKISNFSGSSSALKKLKAEQTNAVALLTSLQQSVAYNEANLRVSTNSLIASSRVLDTGTAVAAHSKKKFLLEYVGGSIFGCLMIGLIIVAVGAVTSDRLRRRDDVAKALGAPVSLSLPSSDGGGKLALAQRGQDKQRALDLQRFTAYLGNSLLETSGHPASMAIVALDDTKFVAEAVRATALSLVRDRKRVVLTDLSGGALSRLLGVQGTGVQTIEVDGGRLVFIVPASDELAPIGPEHRESGLGLPEEGISTVHSAADAFLVLAVLNPAVGAAHLRTWASRGVAVVTAGRSSGVRVQAVGDMIRFADVRLMSAALLGADKSDETLGYVAPVLS
jgi:hypothetical protein